MIGKNVVVRSSPSGVWHGVLQSRDGGEVTLANARRAWSWTKAASCSGLATAGPGSDSKITLPVASVVVREVCEIIECADAATAQWEGVKPWVA